MVNVSLIQNLVRRLSEPGIGNNALISSTPLFGVRLQVAESSCRHLIAFAWVNRGQRHVVVNPCHRLA